MVYVLLFFSALTLSFLLFRPTLALSKSIGAIDYPSSRKIHTKPTARAGGFMIFLAFSFLSILLPIEIGLKIPLLLGGTSIFVVGLLDDAVGLSPFAKLSGQFLSLAVYNFTSELLEYKNSPLEAFFSSIWIIFITNATNIIDGLDGLSGGVSASESISLLVIALILRNQDVFLCSVLLFGAIIGFLPHNFPKAKIFMGDCGALFLGFTLGILSSRAYAQSPSLACLIAMLIVFRIPIYDTKFSIVRRLARGKNPFRADKGHFHHILIRRGFTQECAALLFVTLSLFFGLIGIIILLLAN